MDLDGIGDRAAESASEDHRAHHQMVRKRDVRPDQPAHLFNGPHVRLDVAGDLLIGALGECPRGIPS